MILNSLPIPSMGGGSLPGNVMELRAFGFGPGFHVYMVVSPSLDVSDLPSGLFSAVAVVTCSNIRANESATVYFPDGVSNVERTTADIPTGAYADDVLVPAGADPVRHAFLQRSSVPGWVLRCHKPQTHETMMKDKESIS